VPGLELRNVFGTDKSLKNINTRIQVTYYPKGEIVPERMLQESFVLNPKQFEGGGTLEDKQKNALISMASELKDLNRQMRAYIRLATRDDDDPPLNT
jgi:hypothetical protein